MSTTRAEKLYEQHIKSLPEAEQLCLVELIARQLAAQAPPRQRSLLELEGLGVEMWQGIDASSMLTNYAKNGSTASNATRRCSDRHHSPWL